MLKLHFSQQKGSSRWFIVHGMHQQSLVTLLHAQIFAQSTAEVATSLILVGQGDIATDQLQQYITAQALKLIMYCNL